MAWREESIVSQRLEFVTLASGEGANVRELCRRFRISAPTGYKWIERYRAGGEAALLDRSRRPRRSPERSDERVEAAVAKVRGQHPARGARKIRAVLASRGGDVPAVGTVHAVRPRRRPEGSDGGAGAAVVKVRGQRPAWGARKVRAVRASRGVDGPAVSTVHAILVRRGCVEAAGSSQNRAVQRFERDRPNALWQMDFKGHVPLHRGGRCHPLTIVDDHSRFALALRACANER